MFPAQSVRPTSPCPLANVVASGLTQPHENEGVGAQQAPRQEQENHRANDDVQVRGSAAMVRSTRELATQPRPPVRRNHPYARPASSRSPSHESQGEPARTRSTTVAYEVPLPASSSSASEPASPAGSATSTSTQSSARSRSSSTSSSEGARSRSLSRGTNSSHRHPSFAPSPLAQEVRSRQDDLDLIEQGNAFFLAEPSNFANAAKCWLTAAQGNAADRRALFEGVKATARGGAGRPGHLLDLFHWSWLTPHVVEATKSFAHVASKDGKAREAMEHMLAQVETASVDAALAGHLRATFSTLVGEPYRAQVTLVTALFMNEFGEAKVLAERMQNSYPRLLIGHCVSFICAFEMGGGTHPQGQTMRELNNRIFWAQGLVSTVQRFTTNVHVFAQGAISLALYRQVWIRFLNCYAALSSNAFVAPPAYARVAATRGGDPRCLGGLLWPELVALPYPKPWWEHSQDMARVYTQVLNPAQPDAAPAP